MEEQRPRKVYKLGTEATYRICVQGKLSERYSDQLGGLTITYVDDDEAPVTILYGWLMDQASLLGVLNTLYNTMHLPLLSIELVDTRKEGSTE